MTGSIYFHIESMDGLTIGDVITLEDAGAGRVKIRQVRDLLARFVVDEDGSPVPFDAAQRMIDSLPAGDFESVVQAFTDRIDQWRSETVIPKANAADSP